MKPKIFTRTKNIISCTVFTYMFKEPVLNQKK